MHIIIIMDMECISGRMPLLDTAHAFSLCLGVLLIKEKGFYGASGWGVGGMKFR